MYPYEFLTYALYLLPFLMAALTWNQPQNLAKERMIRVQIIGSLVYLFAYPLLNRLSWAPEYQFRPFDLLESLLWWGGDGILMIYPLVLGAILTAVAWGIRAHIQRKRTAE